MASCFLAKNYLKTITRLTSILKINGVYAILLKFLSQETYNAKSTFLHLKFIK